MGVKKKIYYTIECNHCDKVLEDAADELTQLTTKRQQAVKIAEEHGGFA